MAVAVGVGEDVPEGVTEGLGVIGFHPQDEAAVAADEAQPEHGRAVEGLGMVNAQSVNRPDIGNLRDSMHSDSGGSDRRR